MKAIPAIAAIKAIFAVRIRYLDWNPSNKSNRWILTPFFLMIGEPFQI